MKNIFQTEISFWRKIEAKVLSVGILSFSFNGFAQDAMHKVTPQSCASRVPIYSV